MFPILPPPSCSPPPSSSERWEQWIYASGARLPFAEQELETWADRWRINNRQAGITSLLLYESGSFLQVLEGPACVVADLYARIEGDPRHSRVLLLDRHPIAQREFPDWDLELIATSSASVPSPRASLDQSAPANAGVGRLVPLESGDREPGICSQAHRFDTDGRHWICIPSYQLSARVRELIREFRQGQWRRAFDCGRPQHRGLPICHPDWPRDLPLVSAPEDPNRPV